MPFNFISSWPWLLLCWPLSVSVCYVSLNISRCRRIINPAYEKHRRTYTCAFFVSVPPVKLVGLFVKCTCRNMIFDQSNQQARRARRAVLAFFKHVTGHCSRCCKHRPCLLSAVQRKVYLHRVPGTVLRGTRTLYDRTRAYCCRDRDGQT